MPYPTSVPQIARVSEKYLQHVKSLLYQNFAVFIQHDTESKSCLFFSCREVLPFDDSLLIPGSTQEPYKAKEFVLLDMAQ